MKARSLLVLALTVTAPALAQYSEKKIGDAPQRTTLPQGGLTLDFNEIDRNSDRMISVEEWNAFIEKLRPRSAQGSGSGDAASPAAGSTTGSTAKEPSSPAKAR
jgi:hypothetical protein